MIKSNKLATLFTGTAAILMLSGTSAFAETRHRAETRDQAQPTQQQATQQRATDQRGNWRSNNRDERSSTTSNQRWDRSQTVTPSQTQRFDPRSGNNNRDERSSTTSNQRWDNNRAYNYDRAVNYNRPTVTNESYRRSNASYRPYVGSYDRAPMRNEGRFFRGSVQRYEPFRGGFRVWIGGAPYPFFVTSDLFRHYGIRVGAMIGLGGYWDPLGYYNAYNVPYSYSTAGDIHGVVESVDYRVGSAVIRDDVSGAFVTVLLRGNDPRLGQFRTGDYVDLSGAWNRSGVFDALSVNDLRYGNGGGYGYDGYGQPGYGQPGYGQPQPGYGQPGY